MSIVAHSRVALSLIVSIGLTACGGGGGGSPSSVTPTPTPTPTGMSLVSIDPANGKADVATDALVRLEFSLPVKTGTVNVNSVVLRDGARKILGTPFTTGNKASFSPKNPFSLLTNYQVELTNTISSETGLAYAGTTSSFITRDGLWKTAVQVSSPNAFLRDADYPRVAMDPVGNAYAVWQQQGTLSTDIWASRFNATTALWETPAPIEIFSGEALRPKVAAGGFGTAAAVWKQTDGTRYNIYAVHFSAGTWGAAQLLETDPTAADSPDVAMDVSGNATAVWPQIRVGDATGTYKVFASRFNDTTKTWSSPVFIENDSSGNASEPKVAMNPNNGNALAVWLKDDGTITSLWSSRYDASAGTWSAPELLETSNSGQALDPDVAMNGSGDALVAWRQSDGSKFNLFVNFLDGTSGTWGGAIKLQEDVGSAQPRVAVNAQRGNVLVVWAKGGIGQVWASITQAGKSWGAPQIIASTADGRLPVAALDEHGNATVAWNKDISGGVQMQTSRFNAQSKTWGAPANAQTVPAQASAPSALGVDQAGRMLLLWPELDSSTSRFNLKASRFE